MKLFYFILLTSSTLLFHSIPASAQWIRQYPLAKLEHVVDISLHTDGYGYAAGADDLILKLDPGTQRWELLTTWDGGWNLESVDYLEGTSGHFVAAGGQGLITSDDAGQNWTAVANAPGGILAIKIISATDMVVVGDEGVFRWSNNTWTDLNLPVSSGVDGAYILDDQHIWCFTSGATPVMYSTSNGGGMWNMNTQIERPDVVKFYNALYGVALDGRMVFQTLNGGQQWTMVSNSAIHNSVNDITFGASPNILMAATFNGVPTISVDSGATWTEKDMVGLINQRNYSIAARSDLEFWVGNDLSSITLTTNAGDNWIETSGPDRKIMNDVFFLDRNFGFAVGTEGTLLRTTNGGAIWDDISFGETRSFLSLHGLTANDMWLGANQRIYHSADMGATWQLKASLLGSNFVDILAINTNTILACSASGIIYRSANAGMTWDTVYQTVGQIRSISKIDAQRFMATGFNGLILRSADQGLTWQGVAVPEPGLQYEQTHFIGQEGWMVTSSFKKTMWHTTNAGDSWTPVTLPIDRFWDGVYFITPDTGIVVARSSAEGRAYITFNGGANWQAGYITDFPLYGVTGISNPNGTAWIFGFGSDIEILPYCNMLPVITDFIGDNAPCENDTVTYSITSQDVEQFFWLFPTGWQIQGDPNNDTVQVKVGRNGGTISVTGSNSCGFSSPLSISAGPILLPKLSNLSGDDTPCEGLIIPYTVDETDVDDFIWSIPGDWSIQGNSNQPTVQVQVGAMAGGISVSGSNQCGETQLLNLPVAPELRPRMQSVDGLTSPCEGETVQYGAVGEYYDQVIWTFPADWLPVGNQNEGIIELIIGEASGNVTATGMNPCGLSAVAELQVTPNLVPDVTVLVNGNELSLSQVGTSYQWYLNGVAIDGAVLSEYSATVSGDYYAEITLDNGCLTESNTVNMIISSVGNAGDILTASVYPTPASSTLYIQGIEKEYHYTITDAAGTLIIKSVSTVNAINVSMLPEGVYILRLQQDSKIYLARFVVGRR